MYLFVNGYTADLANYPNVGGLVQPRNWALAEPWIGNSRFFDKPWGVDNDYKRFSAPAFESLLTRLRGRIADPATSGCMFVAVPDVWGNAAATLDLWGKWFPKVWETGFPPAFVVQDGISPKTIPWRDFRVLYHAGPGGYKYSGAIFIGGTDAFRASSTVGEIVRIANWFNLWVHLGRVNSEERMVFAANLGCDSVDGSGYSRWRKLIPYAARVADREVTVGRQHVLKFD